MAFDCNKGLTKIIKIMKLNKSLVYKRAWHQHKMQLKFGGSSSLGYHLKRAYKLAKYVGYNNYKPSKFEINYLNY